MTIRFALPRPSLAIELIDRLTNKFVRGRYLTLADAEAWYWHFV